MNRRNFLRTTASPLALSPWAAFSLHFPNPEGEVFLREGEDLLAALIRENDRGIPIWLQRQQNAPNHPNQGGVPNTQELYHAMGAAMFIQRLASAYSEPQSAYFKNNELVEPMQQAVKFLQRIQHEDGTIDLISTNFHSTPDTGFVVEPLCLAYGLLKNLEDKALPELLVGLESFLRKAGEALTVGGIHTPNHRWVVCMALARIHAHFPDPDYVNRIEQWLAEGIDIDPDGQYTERSTHVYSPLTDRCLITVARLMDKPKLWEPVRKNLDMTLYYLHPDGEIATEASRRQDQYQTGTLQNYYYPYRYMALKTGNGQFATIAERIPRELALGSLLRNLAYFQEDPSLMDSLPPRKSLPKDFEKHFSHSSLVRIRRGDRDATILAQNPMCFTFQQGSAVLQAFRLASAFFGKGQFVGEEIEKTSQGYVLRQRLAGPYFQPFGPEEISGDGKWENMPRALRQQSEVQFLETEVRVWETTQGFHLEISVEGTAGVPIAAELGFRNGGTLSGVTTLPGENRAFLLEDGYGTYAYGGETIRFGPGKAQHRWTQLRGALPKLPALCVYLTAYSPITWTLELEGI